MELVASLLGACGLEPPSQTVVVIAGRGLFPARLSLARRQCQQQLAAEVKSPQWLSTPRPAPAAQVLRRSIAFAGRCSLRRECAQRPAGAHSGCCRCTAGCRRRSRRASLTGRPRVSRRCSSVPLTLAGQRSAAQHMFAIKAQEKKGLSRGAWREPCPACGPGLPCCCPLRSPFLPQGRSRWWLPPTLLRPPSP